MGISRFARAWVGWAGSLVCCVHRRSYIFRGCWDIAVAGGRGFAALCTLLIAGDVRCSALPCMWRLGRRSTLRFSRRQRLGQKPPRYRHALYFLVSCTRYTGIPGTDIWCGVIATRRVVGQCKPPTTGMIFTENAAIHDSEIYILFLNERRAVVRIACYVYGVCC